MPGNPPGQWRRTARLGAVLALAAAGAPAAFAQGAGAVPLLESQRVHRVQVGASVIDPSDRRPVPGLPRDAFRIRVDGVPLDPETAARVEFDEICPAASSAGDSRPGAVEIAPARIVVLADMRYLDLAMRHRTALALEQLSARIEDSPIPFSVRVFAFGPRLVSLTPGFTRRPESLRAAARRIADYHGSVPSLEENDTVMARRPVTPPSTRGTSRMPGTMPNPSGEPERETGQQDLDSSALDVRSIDELLEEGTEIAPSRDRSPMDRLARSKTNPIPSLAALEAVLMAHGHLRGRKALVLFTSSRFDLPDTLWLDYLEETRLAAQGGFALFTVDAGGFVAPPGRRESDMLDYLALTTGGLSLHSTGNLAAAFDRALEYLSCYYLFSLPLLAPERGRVVRHVDISLDSKRYPETWHYRVRSAGQVVLVDPVERRRRRRLAALLEPRVHRVPEVRIATSYPEGKRGTTRISVAAVLSDLTFLPDEQGGHRAVIAIEGAVVDAAGSIVCRLGHGRQRVIRSPSPPARHPPSMLVSESRCDLGGPGRFRIVVAVDDLLGEAVGSAAIELAVPPGETPKSRVSALRLGRNSGRDFVISDGPPDRARVRRDDRRSAFIPLRADDLVAPSDRLFVRFVLCGPPPPPWVIGYRRDAAGGAEPAFQVLVSGRGRGGPGRVACREYLGLVPENSLRPGSYGIALIDRTTGARNRGDLDRILDQGRVLARTEFEVGTAAREPGKPAADETAGNLPATRGAGLPG